VSDLPALLYHPIHPAKLVPERSRNKKPSLIYLHVWNEGRETYVRGFSTLFQARKTVTGIQYGRMFRDYRLTVDITAEEWNILGHTDEFTGVLANWIAAEIAKNPTHYLDEEACRILTLPAVANEVELRKCFILTFLRAGSSCLALPQRPGSLHPNVIHSPMCSLKIGVNRTIRLPKINVSKKETGDLCYHLPPRDRSHESVAQWEERIMKLCMPSPCDLIRPQSINDQSWLLLGLHVKGASIGYVTRATQVIQIQCAQ
jgi:hypothetical protein